MMDEIQTSEFIPDVITVGSFLTARKNEIVAFENAIGKTNRVTSVFQRLPISMRRRAMSHSVKRVPHYLRSAHMKQLERNKALKKSKRPRRKFRRRPKNLLSEYNRRQKKYIWLETHIWHAKRFRMLETWGYKLPDCTYNKTFRASNRAISSHCLVQDISYFCCIELRGMLDILSNAFKLMTNPECGLSITARCWLSGSRQGSVVLFHKNSYPYRVIGNVNFIWKQCVSNTCERVIWLWCHPSYYDELLQELIETFELTYVDPIVTDEPVVSSVASQTSFNIYTDHSDKEHSKISSNIDPMCEYQENICRRLVADIQKKESRNVEEIKLLLKNVPFVRIPKFINHKTNVCMNVLKDSLNRFRLTGPLSNAVLSKAFRSAYDSDFNDKKCTDSDNKALYIESKQLQIRNWWRDYTKQNFSNDFINVIGERSLPNQFPPHSVIGIYIKDPRLFLPHKRIKATCKVEGVHVYDKPLPEWSNSAIWDSHVRDIVTKCKLATSTINKLRSELIVPGHDEHLCHLIHAVIPILLIQRPGSQDNSSKLGYSAGWDIIFPAGWGMPVWLALILCGARPAGLREMKTVNFELKMAPSMPPDSRAGTEYYKELKFSLADHHFRAPPNKRPNYIKLGFPTPFHCPWNTLCNDWVSKDGEQTFFVLRNSHELTLLDNDLRNLKHNRQHYLQISKRVRYSKCIIPVTCIMINSGKIASFSHICLPSASDMALLNGNNKCLVFTEDIHRDNNYAVRKCVRAEHKNVLKHLRAQRIKEKLDKQREKTIGIDENVLRGKRFKRKHSPTEDIVKEYDIRMRNLWIPSDIDSIRNYCCKEIAGFITIGGFSYLESRMIGHGYVTIQSIISLIKLCHETGSFKPLVLVRSPTTLQYRTCEISIICE